MITRANFKSVIVIGAFNPSILTPDFLVESCGFASEHEPEGRTTPVTAEITYGNTRFLTELNKLQIMVSSPQDFSLVFPIDMAIKYLHVLEYTPLNLIGINMNYTLFEANTSGLRESFSSALTAGEVLNVDPISAAVKLEKPNGEGLEFSEATVVYPVNNDIKGNLKLEIADKDLTVNCNFEIGRLDKDRSRVDLLLSEYERLSAENDRLMKVIGKTV